MKKQLFVGFMTLVYLVFCCSGFSYMHVDMQQETVHFTHQDGHSDEYHSKVPGKAAIKAFFAKSLAKGKISSTASYFQFETIAAPDASLGRYGINNTHNFPVKEERYLHHCTFLL
ncbi:hypothetical protein [Flavihumibacter fluvii]|uniref:hypothetical protein n=1 Tax=Flavihumibacter fluvii TaxID=2838157 RepID=UPI001BDE1CEC|nr:hypothetical protein [Flavihumibacter fluvii]ULQ52662.1 hypothetical protein KJS93_21470 [Flavihumibacter fluvii]